MSDYQDTADFDTLFGLNWTNDMTSTYMDGGFDFGDPEEPSASVFDDIFGDMGDPSEPQQDINPAIITSSSTDHSPVGTGEYDLFTDHAETPPAGPTIEELQQQIGLLKRQKEEEMTELKAQHAVEMEAMRLKNEILTASLEQLKTAAAASSPTAMNAYEQFSPPTYPSGVIFNGTQAYAPAIGSSPPIDTTTTTTDHFQTSLLQSQLTNSPTPAPKTKGKGKPRAPAKPRASAASKPTAKVSKSTHKRKSSGPSPAAVRSLDELYQAQFGTLTNEEKSQLVLPLLQGINPNTGAMTGACGIIATDADFAFIGEDTFDNDMTLSSLPYESSLPYKSPCPSQDFSSLPYKCLPPSRDFSSLLLPVARSLDDLAMVQQAAQELGPGALGGAMRQYEVLQRTHVRRR